jgi:hypothetical protein
MAVEVEPSCQKSVTDSIREAVRQMVSDMEIHMKQRYERMLSSFFMQKKLHPLTSMLAERLQRQNCGCEHSETVGGVFQQWQQ